MNESKINILSSVIYNTNEFCALCFSSLQTDNVPRLSDEVVYDTSINSSKVITDMLSKILGTEATNIAISRDSQICDSCFQQTINAYKFIETCESNLNVMRNFIYNLTSSIAEIENPEICNTAFLTVNPFSNKSQTYLDTKRRIPSVKKALSRLKTLQMGSGNDYDKEYSCKMCCQEFATYVEAEDHCEQCPGPTRYKCHVCSMPFARKKHLERHCKKIHSEDAITIEMDKVCKILTQNDLIVYQCNHCLTEFKKFSVLQVHCKKIHNVVIKTSFQELEIQDYEEMETTFEKDFNTSLILIQNEMNLYHCSLCAATFSEYHGLQQHYVNSHKQIILKPLNEGILCSICGITFKNNTLLKRHEETHEKTVSLPSHEGIICSICGKTFKHKSLLKNHEASHKNKEITCPLCKKVYRSYAYYKQHVCNPGHGRNIHEKKFECDYCGKKFCHKAGVRNHIRYWHLSGGHYCSICNKRCANPAALQDHFLVHTREKNFECSVCFRKFGVKSALKSHMRLHTGETPYPCDVCGMKFISSSRRADHFRIHHVGPTKACDICSKKFHKTDQLNQHRQRHFKNKSL